MNVIKEFKSTMAAKNVMIGVQDAILIGIK
jgi:hypothetical protein